MYERSSTILFWHIELLLKSVRFTWDSYRNSIHIAYTMQGTQRICANKDFQYSMLIKKFSCDIDFQRFLLKRLTPKMQRKNTSNILLNDKINQEYVDKAFLWWIFCRWQKNSFWHNQLSINNAFSPLIALQIQKSMLSFSDDYAVISIHSQRRLQKSFWVEWNSQRSSGIEINIALYVVKIYIHGS